MLIRPLTNRTQRMLIQTTKHHRQRRNTRRHQKQNLKRWRRRGTIQCNHGRQVPVGAPTGNKNPIEVVGLRATTQKYTDGSNLFLLSLSFWHPDLPPELILEVEDEDGSSERWIQSTNHPFGTPTYVQFLKSISGFQCIYQCRDEWRCSGKIPSIVEF